MQTHGRRKHKAQKRALVVGNEHRPFFESTPGGAKTLAKLEQAVATEAARVTDQETARSQQQKAVERTAQARHVLTQSLRHISKVSTLVSDEGAPTFARSRPPNDEQLIARAEAIVAGTSAHTDAFVNGGVQPALLATLSSEVAAFKKAKDGITLSGKLYTEASAALDQALEEGGEAVAVLEGILATSPDAPVGAHTAFKQAKLIGPRDSTDDAASTPAAPAPTAPAPARSAPRVAEVPPKAA